MPTAPDGATRRIGRLLRRDGFASPSGTTPAELIDHHVPSRPETVAWGHVPTRCEPVATIEAGARLRIDTVSHQGMTTEAHPTEFFGAFGVPADEVLADVIDIFEQVERPPGANSHVLTGPVQVPGARVGDALEVRIVAADLRVPYGINHSRPGGGVLPTLLEEASTRLLRLDASGRHVAFAPGVSVPVAPFPGIVAVAPPETAGFVPSRVPARWGGNLDVKALGAGARIFLPVLQDGAQFFIGDPHAVQGDGEVNGTAVEQSSSYTLEFVVHPGLAPRWPVVASATHVLGLGIDDEVSTALAQALRATIDLVIGMTDGRLDEADAYALCSIAADLGVAEAVNVASVVQAAIPKSLFYFDARQPPST